MPLQQEKNVQVCAGLYTEQQPLKTTQYLEFSNCRENVTVLIDYNRATHLVIKLFLEIEKYHHSLCFPDPYALIRLSKSEESFQAHTQILPKPDSCLLCYIQVQKGG